MWRDLVESIQILETGVYCLDLVMVMGLVARLDRSPLSGRPHVHHRFHTIGVHLAAMNVESVPQRQRGLRCGDDRSVHAGGTSHPAVVADVPLARRSSVIGMIEIGDPLRDDPWLRIGVTWTTSHDHWTGVIHPSRRLAEDRRLADETFAAGEPPAAKHGTDRLGYAYREEAEVRLLKLDLVCNRLECPLQIEDVLAVLPGNEGGDHVLFDEWCGIVPVEPANPHGDGRFIAIVVDEPVRLTHEGFGLIVPEVDSEQLVVCPKNRSMMIVIVGPGVSHPRQRFSRVGTDQRIEERTWGIVAEAPAGAFLTVDAQRHLLRRKWDDVATRGDKHRGHNQKKRSRKSAKVQEVIAAPLAKQFRVAT